MRLPHRGKSACELTHTTALRELEQLAIRGGAVRRHSASAHRLVWARVGWSVGRDTTHDMEHHRVAALAAFEEQWHFSHVVATSGLLLLSGVTGTDVDGRVSSDPRAQFEQAFAHLGLYLAAAGATVPDIAEMTSYHVDLRKHLADFMAVKDRHIGKPYPAWSAIGVSELITPGALVEMRVIARAPGAPA